MALFMHSGPAFDRLPAFVPGVRCLRSWIDRDTELRHTIILGPDRATAERAWPEADLVELFASAERWMPRGGIRSACTERSRSRPGAVGVGRRCAGT